MTRAERVSVLVALAYPAYMVYVLICVGAGWPVWTIDGPP